MSSSSSGKNSQLSLIDQHPTVFDKRRIEKIISSHSNPLEVDDITYQHSVLCQTCLPYRDPGKDIIIWERRQGAVSLLIEAGRAYHPAIDDYEQIGLPYGPKARIILMYLNQLAIRTKSPIVDVEETITSFIKRLDLDTGGKTINAVKEQIRRLAACHMSITFTGQRGAPTIKTPIIEAYDAWYADEEKHKVPWSSTICLGQKFFESLMDHAVPLDERHIAILSGNAMALDIYSWLAQRLHRVNIHQPQFVAWQNLKEQFGANYSSMRKFKQVFRKTLHSVLQCYNTAKIQEKDNKGFYLRQSPPPVPIKLLSLG